MRSLNLRYIQTRLCVWGEPRDAERVTRGSRGGRLETQVKLCAGRLPYFLLGFIGPKSEALEIKRRIGEFLSTLELAMSEKKTLVTHATTGRARFLGYDVHVARNNNKLRDSRRTLNGTPLLSVPAEVANEWKRRYRC